MKHIRASLLIPAVVLMCAIVINPANATTILTGIIGQWQTTTSLLAPRMDFALIRAGDFVFLINGCVNDCIFGPTRNVERANISPAGDIDTWQSMTQTIEARQGPSGVYAGDYIYILGGHNGQALSAVDRARVNVDGSLGNWDTLTPMTTPRFRFATAVIGNYLYAIGGFGDSGELNSVERTVINPDGTLGAWEFANNLTVGRSEFASFIAGNYLYVLGGEGRPDGNWVSLDSIERSAINPDGSIGIWEIVASMPTGRHSFTAVYSGGDLYVIGGNTTWNPSPYLNTVEKATFNPDGSIGSWQSMPSMTTARNLYGATIAGSYIYSIGGYDQMSRALKTVERATIIIDNTPPIISAFSINSGALATLSNTVALTVSASDTVSRVVSMSFYKDGANWSDWLGYSSAFDWSLEIGDGLKTVYARVKDLAGNISTVSQQTIQLNTTVPPEYGFTINSGALFTNDTNARLTIGAYPRTSHMQISNDGGFAGAIWEPYTSHKTWQITQYGNYVMPRVVYVRYKDLSGTISATYQDDIILDVTAPTGSVSITGTNSSSNVRLTGNVLTLALSATDDVSGVGTMELSNRADFAGANWQAYTTSAVWTLDSNNTVYVRFKDNAGNVSQSSAARGQRMVYMPLVIR